jgi:hypothetical protein
MAETWSLQDDLSLWAQRSKPASQVASSFGKTAGAIRSRLKHLQDRPTKLIRGELHQPYSPLISREVTLLLLLWQDLQRAQMLLI